jgi:hypothetical protein
MLAFYLNYTVMKYGREFFPTPEVLREFYVYYLPMKEKQLANLEWQHGAGGITCSTSGIMGNEAGL